MLKQSHFVRGAGILLVLGCVAVAQPPAGPPGGRFELPKPGDVLPTGVQQRLKLTADQKKDLAAFQKDVDAKLEKILTAEQKKSLQEMRDRPFGPGGGPPMPFGGPGGFPPGGFGPMGGVGTVRLADVKKSIGATDEEWKVIGPKLQKIIAARQILTAEARGDAKGGAAPRPNEAPAGADAPRPAPPGGGGESNIITQAHADFKAVLDDPKHTKDDLREAAAAVRKAREKARTELVAAQKDLRQLLTEEQETILLGLGYLD